MATPKTPPMIVPWNLADMLARIAGSLHEPQHQGSVLALARTASHLQTVVNDPARLAEFCRLYQIPTPAQYMDAVLKQEAADRDEQEHVANLEQRLAEIDAAAAAKRAKRHAAAAARRAAKVRDRTKLIIAPKAARPAAATKPKAAKPAVKRTAARPAPARAVHEQVQADVQAAEMRRKGMRRLARREAQRRYRAKKREAVKT